MVLGSPSHSIAAKLVYWSGADAPSGSSGPNPAEEHDAELSEEWDQHARSMYVELFEDMLKIVLHEEGKLFLEEELNCFMAWHRLTYNAKYLFCRLCLRKEAKWHRLSALQYERELGPEGILEAILELCGSKVEEDVKPKLEDLEACILDIPLNFTLQGDLNPKVKELDAPIPKDKPKQEEPEIIDLTLDTDEELPKAGPSRLSPVYEPPPSSTTLSESLPDYSVFADNEDRADNSELLRCLNLQELDDLAKQMRQKPRSKKREALISAILSASANQTTLSFKKVKVVKVEQEPMIQTKLPFGPKKTQPSMTQTRLPFKRTPECLQTQQERVCAMVMQKLKKCIRLNPDVVALFRRANLVYFRSTQHSPELLTPALLARARKRVYADYTYLRTADIWRTRDDLLAYERALVLEAEVDVLLDGSGGTLGAAPGYRDRSTASRTPAPSTWSRPKTPMAPGKTKDETGGAEQESVRVASARAVKEIFQRVYPQWQDLVVAKGEEDPRRKGLERFDCGHVLTRVVCKGAHALGILKEYHEELQVLEALLEQRWWRRGRRGRWYERRALVLMTHLKDEEGRSEEAMQVVVAAFKDPDTHIVFRPMLERRLTKLEKRLKIPPEEQHVCEGSLKAATNVFVEGVRIRHRADSLMLDHGRVVNESPAKTQELSWKNRREPTPNNRTERTKPDKGGKTIWKGRDDEKVSVETLALQWYEDQHGCKGFHCEGRIVTTLFGLLFWEVIFAPLPGAFETRYQSAPLDLVEDTFYHSRQTLADSRLEEIQEGHAASILECAYDANKDKMCVGVRWDLFEKDELLGIVRCLDPAALVAICRLMCEDYAGRTAGVPDLIVWNEEEEYAKFVEVKGPGDTLQENQKVWIDVLLQAGMPVEVCHVYEQGEKPKVKGRGTTQKKAKATAGQKRKRDPDDWLVESEDEDVDYSQYDRHTEDEVLSEDSPAKKRQKMREPADAGAEASLTARKVAKINCQPEVVILPVLSQSASVSPPRRRRD